MRSGAGLLASARDDTPGAVAAFARYGADLTDADARTVVASEHGLDTWDELATHIANLDGDPFATTYRLLEAQDVDGLAALLDESPGLVRETGTNGNDLLGLAGADERLARVLLDRARTPAAPTCANVHGPGHRCTRPPTLASPTWRATARAGAPLAVSARGDGGTPLVIALFWGYREVAELLAERSLAPGNLRVAAGLERVDLLDSPGTHRGFHRPHGGFPFWRPSDDPAEIRNEALTYAARDGRVEALEGLAERGAALNADVYRGTVLTWAAFTGQAGVVRKLPTLGADVNRRGTFGGPDHGQGVTALHLAVQNNRLEVIIALLDAGAAPSIEDDLFGSSALGWAEFFGRTEAKELLEA